MLLCKQNKTADMKKLGVVGLMLICLCEPFSLFLPVKDRLNMFPFLHESLSICFYIQSQFKNPYFVLIFQNFEQNLQQVMLISA